MEITNEQLNIFKKLYKERFGADLGDAEATEVAEQVLALMEILYHQIDS